MVHVLQINVEKSIKKQNTDTFLIFP